MHVAAGRPENGLTPVALVPIARMALWVEGDPDLIVPETLLLLPPAEGLVRRGLDHRGLAAAFSVEPELAALLVGDAPVETIDEEAFEAGLAAALADPVLNLRQGPFARRRQWRIDDRPPAPPRLAGGGAGARLAGRPDRDDHALFVRRRPARGRGGGARRPAGGRKPAAASARSRLCCSKRCARPPISS